MSDLPLTDLALERSLIATALANFDRFLVHGLGIEDFSDIECRDIFELCTYVHEMGTERVSHASVARACKDPRAGSELAKRLGEFYFEPSVMPDPERLRELRRYRETREHSMRAAAHAERGEMDEAQVELELAQKATVGADVVTGVADVMDLTMAYHARMRAEAGQQRRQAWFGHQIFQRAVGPLAAGSLTIIGADTNVGKTSYALELCLASAESGTKCGFISCEDPEDIMLAKVISAYSNLSARQLMYGNLPLDGHAQIEASLGRIDRALRGKLKLGFKIGGTDMEVAAAMSRMAAEGCQVIVGDYVQAMEPSKRQQDRRNDVRFIASRLKAHANRLGVALVLLSQIVRPSKGDEQREPTRHDLKESGDLTNMAESIALLWRKENSEHAPIHVKLDKGKLGNLNARWQVARDQTMRLREVPDSYTAGGQ